MGFCKKHKIEYGYYWCPMCLNDDFEAQIEQDEEDQKMQELADYEKTLND